MSEGWGGGHRCGDCGGTGECQRCFGTGQNTASIQTEKNARIVVDLACAPLAVIARVESSRLDFLILERQEWALGSVGELNRPYGGLVISGNQRNLHCDIELYFSGLSL